MFYWCYQLTLPVCHSAQSPLGASASQGFCYLKAQGETGGNNSSWADSFSYRMWCNLRFFEATSFSSHCSLTCIWPYLIFVVIYCNRAKFSTIVCFSPLVQFLFLLFLKNFITYVLIQIHFLPLCLHADRLKRSRWIRYCPLKWKPFYLQQLFSIFLDSVMSLYKWVLCLPFSF